MSQTIPNSNPKSTEVSMIRPLLKRYLNLKHLTQHQLRYSISPSKSFIRSKIDDIIQSKLSNFENNPQKICKNRLDLYEETQIIYKNFSLLFWKHYPEAGSRFVEDTPVIHVKNVIQHYLDCCISSQVLQNYLMLPLKDEDWVDIDSFLQSIEAIHMTSLDKNSFFYKEPSSSHKKNLTMQKLLCNPHLVFYKLLEFCDSSELRKEKLQIVISMGLKKLKKPINNLKLTDWILEKSNSNLENKKDTINFEDFFCIMKN